MTQSPTFDPNEIRATRAIVDLDAIAENVRILREALPATCRLMAVVKADGYGHGAPWIATTALAAGASLLGVATVSEGRALRDAGIDAPILVIGSIDATEAPAACRSKLEITVADARLIEAIQIQARRADQHSPVAVHLKIDTGLRRYGASPEESIALAQRIAADPQLQFAGLFTHFASADEPHESFTDVQLQRFWATANAIELAGIALPDCHVANSAAIITGRHGGGNMARAGIALYGVPPSDDVPLLPAMRPALRLESRITRLIPIEPGDSVGYNRTYRAESPTTGALIPIGYADGYRRALIGRAWVGMEGQRAPVLGRISMDQTVVEIPKSVFARVGDIVHILGGDPESGAPTISDMADLMETNAYEVLVSIRRRIPRVFVRGGEIVGIRA